MSDEQNTPVEDDDVDTVELWPLIELYTEIPKEFHSLADGPFTKCVMCETGLLGGDERYVIERIFRGAEPIIEYALCMKCHDQLCAELSQDSLQAIKTFYEDVDFDVRFDRLREHVRASVDEDKLEAGFYEEEQVCIDVSPWLDHCLVTGKPSAECHGRQLIAMCKGSSLELSVSPFMLSDKAVESMLKKLSKKTRDRLDDFVGDHFGMPPEYCESPDSFPVLV